VTNLALTGWGCYTSILSRPCISSAESNLRVETGTSSMVLTKLNTKLLHLGFMASKADSYLVIIWTPTYCIFILIYVDDIILTGSSSSTIDDLLVQLCMEFVVKDLGPLRYFLGGEVTKVPNGLMLSQQCHIYKH
jgi:hypothetical protein